MSKIGLALAVLVSALAPNSSAQPERSLVGTWKLVSGTTRTINGNRSTNLYGRNPVGFITYTPDGRMTVVIAADGRKPLSVADRVAAPRDERADAFATFIAYAGRYSFLGDRLIHHIEVSSFQNWVNTDQTRFVTFTGEQVTFRTPPIMLGGELQISEVVWERLK